MFFNHRESIVQEYTDLYARARTLSIDKHTRYYAKGSFILISIIHPFTYDTPHVHSETRSFPSHGVSLKYRFRVS